MPNMENISLQAFGGTIQNLSVVNLFSYYW